MIYESNSSNFLSILEDKIEGENNQIFISIFSHGGTDKIGELWFIFFYSIYSFSSSLLFFFFYFNFILFELFIYFILFYFILFI